MRIVEVIRGLGLGGAETLLYHRLQVWKSEGIDVVVLNTHPEEDYYADRIRALGVSIVAASSASILSGIRAVRLVEESMQSSDVLLVHSPAASVGIKLERLVRPRGVAGNPRLIEMVHSTRYRWQYEFIGRLLNGVVDLAVYVSGDVRYSRAATGYRRGRVLHGGVVSEKMRAWITSNTEAPNAMLEAEGLPRGRGLIVSVGNLFALKGHHKLLAALALDQLADCSAVIVGEGPERERLEGSIRNLGLEDRVRLLGRRDDAWQWIAVADVICHPSSFEGLPVALMEASALGVPIVATDTGGVREVATGRLDKLIGVSDGPPFLADALNQTLDEVAPIRETFPKRAGAGGYWDVKRYAGELLEVITAGH